MVVALLVLVAGAVTAGVLSAGGWRLVLVAVGILLVLRPAVGWLSTLGSDAHPLERGAIAFFGIRGMGSVYYLAHGLNAASFEGADVAWALVTAVILGSVLAHGMASTPVMAALHRRGEA